MNIKNGNNTKIIGFDATGNPDLKCIQVDDAQWSKDNWTQIDTQTSFSEFCRYCELLVDKESILDNGEEAVITAKLYYDEAPSNDITVDLTASGTALASEFELSSTNIIIPAGQLSGSVTLKGLNNIVTDKTVILDISSVTNGTELGEQQVSVQLIRVNDAPTDITLESSEFAENITNVLTKIIVEDSDDTTHNITLVDGEGSDDNADFRIEGDMLYKTVDFDYETKNEYKIRLKAVDAGGLFIEKALIINIINVNDITITGVVTNNYCSSGDVSKIETTVTEYVAPLTYQWSSSETTSNISGKPSGTYTLTVTDAEGMTKSKNFTIGNEPIYNDFSICYVTSDETSLDNNRIFFSNPGAYNIDKIQILREGNVAGYYDVIAEIFSTESSYLDTSSDNQVQSYKYVVRIKDKCGNTSESSAPQKTILLQANKAAGGSVNLNWSAYEGLSYGTYDIYRKVNDGAYTVLKSLSSGNLNYNDTDAKTDTNLYSYYIGITLNTSCSFTSKAANKSARAGIQIRSNIKKIESSLGIDDDLLSKGLKLYPNPVTQTLSIRSESIPLTKVEVYSPIGKKVLEIQSEFSSISTDHLSSGIYMVRIYSEKGVAIRKLIKK